MGIYYLKFFKSSLIFGICFLFATLTTLGQAREGNGASSSGTKSKKGFQLDPDRIVVGGGFGAQFGAVTYVELSPTVGYLITDNWLAGVGGRYIYLEEDLSFFTYKTNIYGGNVFNQYYFLESFIAHTEFEWLNLERFDRIDERIDIGSLLVGGGYRSQIGSASFGSILILFNLNESIHSPYTNPIFRVNFGFGL